MTGPGFRYGRWRGGPDPLAPPYDLRAAVDRVGEQVLAGRSAAEALGELLRRGMPGRPGLDDLGRRVRQRQRQLRRSGPLDGTLRAARELLDRALGQERAALAEDPSEDARFAEQELAGVPDDLPRAVRRLADYAWRSPDAAATFQQLRDLLRRDVLDAHFRGLRDALTTPDPAALARLRQMLGELNQLLAADARGQDVGQAFGEFMSRYGDLFPDSPQTLAELVDSLARRAAAAARLLDSLSPEQRDELAGLLAGTLGELGLADQLAELADQLRARRPDLAWSGGERLRGASPQRLGDATTALEELADLAELSATLGQDYPGASLEDVDEEAVARALGRPAVDDLAALRDIERELSRQGYLTRVHGDLQLTPRAVRRIGEAALRRVFAGLAAPGRGDHDVPNAGATGELTGGSRPWRFGDEQPLDVVRTVQNAVLRTGPTPGPVRLAADDFAVLETERRSAAAVALLVDLSYSMALRNTWAAAKSTALALHTLVSTRYPQDRVQIVGFSDHARVLHPVTLAGLTWDLVQGTNLQHALLLAGRHLDRYPDAEPVVLVVTDGEPTAHLRPDGSAYFAWPPHPRTVALTLAEVDKLTRRGATINVFMLDDEPRLVRFVQALARRNGGRVFSPDPTELGEYVVSDYLRARRGHRRTPRAG